MPASLLTPGPENPHSLGVTASGLGTSCVASKGNSEAAGPRTPVGTPGQTGGRTLGRSKSPAARPEPGGPVTAASSGRSEQPTGGRDPDARFWMQPGERAGNAPRVFWHLWEPEERDRLGYAHEAN